MPVFNVSKITCEDFEHLDETRCKLRRESPGIGLEGPREVSREVSFVRLDGDYIDTYRDGLGKREVTMEGTVDCEIERRGDHKTLVCEDELL